MARCNQYFGLLLVALVVMSHGVKSSPSKAPTFEADATTVDSVRKEFQLASEMPEESQKALLKVMGAGLVGAGKMPCNIFGGKGSCTPLSGDSKLAKSCNAANREVDCAFKSEALLAMAEDPDSAMRKRLARAGYPACDRCFDALHKFWCAQTAPLCGTFDMIVDEILPVFTAVAGQGKDPVKVMRAAVPRILAAFALGLPCREMCDAVTATCGCGEPTTFGQMMTALKRRQSRGLAQPYATNMTAATAKNLFAGVWDKPVCGIFASRHEPGFGGVCDVPPAAELTNCSWCQTKMSRPGEMDEQIVAQVAESMSAVMQTGLQRGLDSVKAPTKGSRAAAAGSHRGSDSWNWDDEPVASSPKPRHRGGAIVFLLVFVLASAGAVAAGWYIHQRRSAQPHQYVDLNSMGYTAPEL